PCRDETGCVWAKPEGDGSCAAGGWAVATGGGAGTEGDGTRPASPGSGGIGTFSTGGCCGDAEATGPRACGATGGAAPCGGPIGAGGACGRSVGAGVDGVCAGVCTGACA